MRRERIGLAVMVVLCAAASIATSRPQPMWQLATPDIGTAPMKLFPAEPRKSLHLEFEVSPQVLKGREPVDTMMEIEVEAKVLWHDVPSRAPSILELGPVGRQSYLPNSVVLRPREPGEIRTRHVLFFDEETACDPTHPPCIVAFDVEFIWYRAGGGLLEIEPVVRAELNGFASTSSIPPPGAELRLLEATVGAPAPPR